MIDANMHGIILCFIPCHAHYACFMVCFRGGQRWRHRFQWTVPGDGRVGAAYLSLDFLRQAVWHMYRNMKCMFQKTQSHVAGIKPADHCLTQDFLIHSAPLFAAKLFKYVGAREGQYTGVLEAMGAEESPLQLHRRSRQKGFSTCIFIETLGHGHQSWLPKMTQSCSVSGNVVWFLGRAPLSEAIWKSHVSANGNPQHQRQGIRILGLDTGLSGSCKGWISALFFSQTGSEITFWMPLATDLKLLTLFEAELELLFSTSVAWPKWSPNEPGSWAKDGKGAKFPQLLQICMFVNMFDWFSMNSY